MSSVMASESTVQPDFPAAHTNGIVALQELVAQQVSDPAVGWKSEETTELARSSEGNRARKLTIPVRKPQKLAACRKQSVGGKGVIFTAASAARNQRADSQLVCKLVSCCEAYCSRSALSYMSQMLRSSLPHT